MFPILDKTEHEGVPYDYLRFNSPADMLAYALKNNKREFMRLARDLGADWAGLGEQSAETFGHEGYSSESLRLFRAAMAKLAYSPALGNTQAPSVAGGAWVMPLVLSSQPMCARTKMRNKLPPKNLLVRIGTHGGISAEALATPCAKIARAIWDYQTAGGIITLNMWQASRYHARLDNKNKTSRGTYGIRIDCKIPLSSEAAISTALGIPLYRLAYLAIAHELTNSDGVYSALTPSPANVIWLQGNETEDNKQLAKGLA